MINVDYLKFISYRYDLVLRYYFLEAAGFNLARAWKLSEEKRFGFIRRIAQDVGQDILLFKVWEQWQHVYANMNLNPSWIQQYPYIVTSEGVGVSVKRFLVGLMLDVPLCWTISDKYRKDIKRKASWERDNYIMSLPPERSRLFMDAEIKMLSHMQRLGFFRPACFVPEDKAELI